MKFMVIILCLTTRTRTETLSSDEEKALAEYYKTEGTITWKWNIRLFCRSQTPCGERPGFFRSAYIRKKEIMLTLAECTKIHMEVLHCEHIIANIHEWAHEWRREMYVNDQNGHIFTLHSLPKTSECYAYPVDIIYYKIFDGERAPITNHVDVRQSSINDNFFGTRRLNRDELVEKYYEANGIIEWKFEMKPFCVSKGTRGYFDMALLETWNIMLENARCVVVLMEVLTCLYRADQNVFLKEYYANNVHGDIFTVRYPPPYSPCSSRIKIMSQIVNGGERQPITTRVVQKGSLPDEHQR